MYGDSQNWGSLKRGARGVDRDNLGFVGFRFSQTLGSRMENQMEETMENEMEPGILKGFSGLRIPQNWNAVLVVPILRTTFFWERDLGSLTLRTPEIYVTNVA